MRAAAVLVALALVTTGCKRKPSVEALPDLGEAVLLDRLADRPVPGTARARFSIKLRSKPLGIAAPPLGGGLVVDRPSQAYLAVMNPVGGPVLQAATDGSRLVVLNNRDRKAFEAEDVGSLLGGDADGGLAVDDLVDLLVGLLPVTADQLVRNRRDGAARRMLFRRPGGVTLTAWVDPGRGTPTRLEVDDAKGTRVVEATFGPFEAVDDTEVPTRVTLFVPRVELTVDLRYKAWEPLDTAPDVFRPMAPEGFEVLPMSAFAEGMGELAEEAAPTDDPADEGGDTP